MFEIPSKKEISEVPKPEIENYKEMKPESNISAQGAREYWDKLFGKEEPQKFCESGEKDYAESDVEKMVDDYVQDLKDHSDCPETIPDKPFKAEDLEKRTSEENAKMREEFDEKKAQLKKEWEEANRRPWPKYETDVYSSNGKL